MIRIVLTICQKSPVNASVDVLVDEAHEFTPVEDQLAQASVVAVHKAVAALYPSLFITARGVGGAASTKAEAITEAIRRI